MVVRILFQEQRPVQEGTGVKIGDSGISVRCCYLSVKEFSWQGLLGFCFLVSWDCRLPAEPRNYPKL